MSLRYRFALIALCFPFIFAGSCDLFDGSDDPEPRPSGGFAVSTDGLEATFQTTVSVEPGGSVSWDFGDGEIGSGLTTRHTYDRSGSYVVTQTIRSAQGVASDPNRQTVVVQDVPICSFDYDATGLFVTFVDRSERTGLNARYAWTFGDGDDSAEADPLHEYGSPGTYRVDLTVTNTGGSDKCSDVLTVSDGANVSGSSG